MDTFRPQSWDSYIGQERLKRELEIRVTSAIADDRPLDHVFLHGPPGVGKTSIAQIIATRLGEPFEVISEPMTLKPLLRLVRNHSGVVLFDELHRWPTRQQELLLTLLEFGYVMDTNGHREDAGWFTVIGATTELNGIIEPILDRFTIQVQWDPYSDEDMAQIVSRMAGQANLPISDEAAALLGRASVGTPRKAKRFVEAYRDLVNYLGHQPTSDEVLDLCRTEWDGLTQQHVRLLQLLDDLGGAKGIEILGNIMRVPTAVIKNLERLLVEKRLVVYTERGRELTGEGTRRARADHDTSRSPRRKAA